MTTPQMKVYDDPKTLAAAAADWIGERIAASNDTFRLSLAGGSTPRALYEELHAPRFHGVTDWDRVEFFWGDERFVPPDSPDSNYRMARETLLSYIPAPAQNIHPMPTNGDPEDAARQYEAMLKDIYGAQTLSADRPFFDLMLLGMGADGHICSLLPGSTALEERARWVVPVLHGRPEPRLTLTYPLVESSRIIAFLVTGRDKAATVQAVRCGDKSLPAARLDPRCDIVWFLDRAAAGD